MTTRKRERHWSQRMIGDDDWWRDLRRFDVDRDYVEFLVRYAHDTHVVFRVEGSALAAREAIGAVVEAWPPGLTPYMS